MSKYDEIYEELCYRVECGELSIEDAEAINEAAYEKYVSEADYDEFDPEEFDAAYEYALDFMEAYDEYYGETADDYLDAMESVMFEAAQAPYEKYMSAKAYQKLIEKAVKKDDPNVPAKYESDPKFVRQFKKDFKKAKKASQEMTKKGIDKKTAIGAAVAAAVTLAAGGTVAYDQFKNGGAGRKKIVNGAKSVASGVGSAARHPKNFVNSKVQSYKDKKEEKDYMKMLKNMNMI